VADCIFCAIVRGEAPSTRVYEDEKVIAILDIFPWTRGHTLVIPRDHAATIFDIGDEDASAVINAARRLAPALRDAVGAEGLNLLQSNGAAAWQTVDHFHLHLIPRWSNDGLVTPASGSKADPEALEATAKKVVEALG
jgi:histidine triad (HIT) family protein